MSATTEKHTIFGFDVKKQLHVNAARICHTPSFIANTVVEKRFLERLENQNHKLKVLILRRMRVGPSSRLLKNLLR